MWYSLLRLVRRLMLPVRLLASLVFLSSAVAWAQGGDGKVYKSVDDKGRVIYTDTAPVDRAADVIRVPATNTAVAPAVQSAESGAATRTDTAGKTGYQRIHITSPAHNQVFDYGVSAVDVTLTLEPALREGHRLQFFLDGKPHDEAGTALSARFGNLPRGTHTVYAVLVDEKGRRIKSSRPVKFTIQLHTVQQTDNAGDGYDYPYGFGGPRGAGSIDGAGAPRDAQEAQGAESAEGAGSPGYPVLHRPVRHR